MLKESIAIASMLMSSVAVSQADDEANRSKTSADWRSEKPFTVGAELGWFVFPISGAGARIGYNLNPNLNVGFRFAAGEWDASPLVSEGIYTTIDTFTLDASIVEVDAKWFVGNSFYWRVGLGQRQINSDISVTDQYDGTNITATLESTSSAVSIGLGNIWTLDSGLYLGGEWIAASIPLGSSFSSSVTSNAITDEDLRDLVEDMEEVSEDFGTVTTFGLATFLIGYQF
ncbi:hypothetical protein [Pseudobacteriovorax antillogorgiicola]|uniref:Outer membrane protein beta-barrel domain-containing protein n=1 Tax=Pseudobacteriovorax antillogorgiicola TaxID=1513793 RepID=A0A1Y6CCJ9_9BACT|nr:hypothetical protein [Pseudobacteriovorax antillogorgiicola]TCS49339.1 hypothetical protein EDD56_11518 [Pseudobacteriovorax antillogorgiicola]SMF47913.1 hypothetical protein SAMN06296036_114166 [Pseudobacteriovorax antillogorgiicola]